MLASCKSVQSAGSVAACIASFDAHYSERLPTAQGTLPPAGGTWCTLIDPMKDDAFCTDYRDIGRPCWQLGEWQS